MAAKGMQGAEEGPPKRGVVPPKVGNQQKKSFNNMNYHTWRKNLRQGPVLPTCCLCEEPLSEEGAWHLSTECDAAAALARLHLNIFTEDTTKWSWESLRAFILSPTIYRLVTTRTTVPRTNPD